MRAWHLVVVFAILGFGIVLTLYDSARIGPDAGPVRLRPTSGKPDVGVDETPPWRVVPPAPTLEGRAGTEGRDGTAEVAGATLRGTVVDDRTGDPIADASVYAFPVQGEGDDLQARTGAEGRFELTGFTTGVWMITAVHPGYVPPGITALADKAKQMPPAEVLLLVPAGATALPDRALRLRPGRRFTGRVVDTAGMPVPGAHIRLFPDARLRRLRRRLGVTQRELDERFPVRSDAAGRFAFACLPRTLSQVRLGAFKPGYLCPWTEPLSLHPKGAPHELELVLLKGATIQGHVRLPNGDPAAGCVVEPAFGSRVKSKQAWLFEPPDDAIAGPDGAYALAGLPPGTVELDADWREPYLAGAELEVEVLRPGEVRGGVDFTVPQRYVFRARLRTADAKPIQREILTVEGAGGTEPDGDPLEEEDWTDEEGRVALGLPSSGPLRIVHRSPGRSQVLREGILLPADEIELVSTAAKRTRVEVRVVDHEGRPVPRFRSSMWSLAGDGEQNAFDFDSDADGKDGVAAHSVLGPSPFSLVVGQATDAGGGSLQLTKMHTRVERVPPNGIVEVRLAPKGRLTGRFIDVQGKPIAGARLSLTGSNDERNLRIVVPVREDGRFSFDVPPAEEAAFRIEVVVPPGYVPLRAISFDAESPQHAFVLLPAGIVSGRVEAPDIGRLEGQELVLVSWEERDEDPPSMATRLSTALDANGRFEAVGVPMDRPLLVGIHARDARKLGLISPQDIRGVHAGRRDLVLELEPGLAIRGTVTFVDAPTHLHFVVAVPHAVGVTGDIADLAEDGTFALVGLPPGTYMLALLSARGGTNVTLATKHVDAGAENVSMQVGALGSIRITLEGEVGYDPGVTVWKAGSFERRAHVSVGEAGVVLDGLSTGERYDLVVEGFDGPTGSRLGVRTGEEVVIEVVKGATLGGRLKTQRSLAKSRLIARGATGPFPLYVEDDGAFETQVMPGTYDLFLIEPDGTQHLVAKGVKAGRDDYTFTLK